MALLLTTAVPSYSGAITDSFQSIAEQAWMNQYIPRSDEETLPLTDYDNFEVTELFRAETIEDLEASLTDGYPMPWLEEVLKDTTIPWEDRYWLDCRVRAVIAQDLHMFFDRDGNRISVEADYIIPGEDYWRENMIVRPVLLQENTVDYNSEQADLNLAYYENLSQETTREQFSDSSPTLMSDPPGKILNLYGEQVGVLAAVNKRVVLSRDASIGAVQSGGNEGIDYWDRTPYACILYPDGSFTETPFEQTGLYRAAVSADGEVVIFICNHIAYPEHDNQIVDAFVFDRNGNLTNRITPPKPFYGTYAPQISPDGRFSCYPMLSGDIATIDCTNGTLLSTLHPSSNGRDLQVSSISSDGRFLCAGGHSAGKVILLDTGDCVWQGLSCLGINDFSIVRCSNNASFISCNMRRGDYPNYYDQQSIFHEANCISSIDFHLNSTGFYRGDILHTDIAPSGSFFFSEKDVSITVNEALPVIIQAISGGR